MAIIDKKITDKYAAYNGDCIEVLPHIPEESIHLSIYSPPFSDLYNYSSSDRDMSNCRTYQEFFEQYEFLIGQIARVTMPGRLSAVHCMDVPDKSTGGMRDFPGDIIRLHEKHGLIYHDRRVIWKEPLRVAIRTRSKALMNRQIVTDSTECRCALPDYLITFRKRGANKIPVDHPSGLTCEYAGSDEVPSYLIHKYSDWDDPKTNKLAHWKWQRYASSVWHDIRIGRVLPYRKAKEFEEEKHVCPLQLDVIDRIMSLYSNPGEKVLTPFMGVGSEVYGAVRFGRKGIGIELKPTYYRQALINIAAAERTEQDQDLPLEFDEEPEEFSDLDEIGIEAE